MSDLLAKIRLPAPCEIHLAPALFAIAVFLAVIIAALVPRRLRKPVGLRGGIIVRNKRMIVVEPDCFFNKSLNRLEKAALFRSDKTYGNTRFSRASRAADAVNVTFRFKGKVEIDNARDFLYINPARGDICGDKNSYIALLKAFKRLRALILRLVGMDCRA